MFSMGNACTELEAEADIKRRVNSYLVHELWMDGERDGRKQIDDKWPFRFREVDLGKYAAQGTRVFEFSYNGSIFFAQVGSTCTFWLADGVSVNDLQRHMAGEKWIMEHKGVYLGTTKVSGERLPLVAERLHDIEEIARQSLGDVVKIIILEGLYFPAGGSYLALVENLGTGRAFLLGNCIAPREAKHPEVAPWRQMAIAVGEMLLDRKPSGIRHDEDMEKRGKEGMDGVSETKLPAMWANRCCSESNFCDQ